MLFYFSASSSDTRDFFTTASRFSRRHRAIDIPLCREVSDKGGWEVSSPMTIHDMTGGVMPHHLSARSRFMITDILGGPPQPSPSPDRPRDLSLHCRTQQDAESDGHESGTDSAGIPADSSSLGSNGESSSFTGFIPRYRPQPILHATGWHFVSFDWKF